MPNPVIAAKLASAHNDWVLERYLQPEPRLRGLIAISPQNPQAAAKEIRRVGGRDEFVGVFLPGGARIPYGNPVHDPIWEAANELALPVVVHTHYEGVGIAGPVTAAGYPDFYVEYHTLCGSGMYGHFVSILCHGIFERFPEHEGDDGRGRPRPVRRADVAPGHELEGLPERDPVVPQAAVGVRLGSRQVLEPAARDAGGSLAARARDPGPAPVGHALLRERLPALGLRRARPDAAHAAGRSGARTSPGATPPSSTACPSRARRNGAARARDRAQRGRAAESPAAAARARAWRRCRRRSCSTSWSSRHDGDPPRAALRQAGFRSNDVDAWLERRAARSGARPAASTLRGGPGGLA